MYTQCPECEVAFRVTAQVLKQAAGKVRCGGCGVAFNALAHLSEEMPAPPSSDDRQAEPQSVELPANIEAGTPPKSISAEQSAALLKTLDELAGEDIRIEDTGIEWRVMGIDEEEDDELADDPVPSMLHEEMRFDDNTPLPDDFDLNTPPTPLPEPVAVVTEPASSVEEPQIDLAFGEADEWEELLDDLEEAAVTGALEEGDISAELATLPDSIEIEAPEAATEEPLDMDSQFALQAEELGIDLSGMHAVAAEEPETSIDEDLIAAAFEVEAAARAEASAATESDDIEANEINLEDLEADELSRAGILDEDDYLEIITEEDEIAEDQVLEDELLDDELLEDEVLEDLIHEDALEDRILEQALLQEEVPEVVLEEEAVDDAIEDDAEDMAEEVAAEEEITELGDEQRDDEAALEADLEDAFEGMIEEIEVPELSEEEMTINMAIDQDLLAIAVEDDDGFTSTIVQKQVSDADDIPDEIQAPAKKAAAVAPTRDENPLMETIIMEGESVHNEDDLERLEAARVAASLSLMESGFDKNKDSRRQWQPPKHSMAAAAGLLFVVLLIQVIHHSREALAVSPTFQSTIAPVYRLIGSPVTPAWDVTGWRFEATKGSTGDDNNVLTIYSRVGNNSEQTLPYPLVHLSLTDRFEEIVGSRVLEPSEYLFDDADPRRPLRPGETFNAVITIDSPSADATGFKLNVCYRLASGQLRCAIEDFK